MLPRSWLVDHAGFTGFANIITHCYGISWLVYRAETLITLLSRMPSATPLRGHLVIGIRRLLVCRRHAVWWSAYHIGCIITAAVTSPQVTENIIAPTTSDEHEQQSPISTTARPNVINRVIGHHQQNNGIECYNECNVTTGSERVTINTNKWAFQITTGMYQQSGM